MISGHLMCIDDFQHGFNNFATIFEPYTKYCAEQVLCQNYCKDLNRNNALFTAYLAWCESSKECNRWVSQPKHQTVRILLETQCSVLIKCLVAINSICCHSVVLFVFNRFLSQFFRLRLADILVRPMQRLTKYNLLLCAVRKHFSDYTKAEIMDEMVRDLESALTDTTKYFVQSITKLSRKIREFNEFSPNALPPEIEFCPQLFSTNIERYFFMRCL